MGLGLKHVCVMVVAVFQNTNLMPPADTGPSHAVAWLYTAVICTWSIFSGTTYSYLLLFFNKGMKWDLVYFKHKHVWKIGIRLEEQFDLTYEQEHPVWLWSKLSQFGDFAFGIHRKCANKRFLKMEQFPITTTVWKNSEQKTQGSKQYIKFILFSHQQSC